MNEVECAVKGILKFSHEYVKFPESRVAELLQVFVVDYKDLSKEFKFYDTEYWSGGGGFYKLPEGKLIVLLLQAEKLFTTIRRWTPEKEAYYKSLQGTRLKIKVDEKEAI